ncbi:MAG: high frequency lysogenization protein HflD [Xanthomonadaceae bacterium]|nr:high frequency lysogenization protein HflD [Xanthomonadaceae bacterium]
MSPREERALALAGVFQAAALVHEAAWQGKTDDGAAEASLGSLFHFDAPDTASVFGGARGVGLGLRTMVAHLTGRAQPGEIPVMRYTLALMHLERKADARGGVWEALHAGLRAAERQRDGFGLMHENTVAALAGLYADHVSPAGARIMVEGETTHLRDARKAALIRALLLAGIRASVLWRQLGATRWSLLFSRKRLIDDAEQWLA